LNLSNKLPARFLKFCLEAEIFDVKDAKMITFGKFENKMIFTWQFLGPGVSKYFMAGSPNKV